MKPPVTATYLIEFRSSDNSNFSPYTYRNCYLHCCMVHCNRNRDNPVFVLAIFGDAVYNNIQNLRLQAIFTISNTKTI